MRRAFRWSDRQAHGIFLANRPTVSRTNAIASWWEHARVAEFLLCAAFTESNPITPGRLSQGTRLLAICPFSSPFGTTHVEPDPIQRLCRPSGADRPGAAWTSRARFKCQLAIDPAPFSRRPHFTTEARFWFQFNANTPAVLAFTGDDDLWAFVNGTLAIDLGGIHRPVDGSVTLDASTASKYGLVDGGVYEVAIFHAERKRSSSSFRLAIKGFRPLLSQGGTVCRP